MRRVLLAVLASAPLAGCGKKEAKAPADAPAPPAVAVNPANTNFQPGAGAVQNIRQAARRTNALNELRTLGQLVELMYTETWRMPTAEQITASVKQDAPAVAKGIEEGVYILTGTTDHAGVWAYEVDADKVGGILLLGPTPTRATAEEAQQHLAKLPKPPAPPKKPDGKVSADIPAPRRLVPALPGPVAVAPAPRAKPVAPPAPRVVAQRPAPAPAPAAGPVPAPEPAAPMPAEVAAVAVRPQDLEDIRLLIDTASGVTGQMPSKPLTRAALAAAGSAAADLVTRKAIVLTGATTRDSVWAYETAAAKTGGLVAGPGGVETVTADELNRRLASR